MYYRADFTIDGDMTRYNQFEYYKLFGSQAGMICRCLKKQTPLSKTWHLSVRDEVIRDEMPHNRTVVVDIKPKNPENPFVCEITDVWGHSSDDYTPILLRMERLNATTNWQQVGILNPKCNHDVIYSILYVSGGVDKNGKLKDKWTSPPPSSTNGALLWPLAIKHFFKVMMERDRGILGLESNGSK